MKIHKTRDTPPQHPVLYRHAKCKNCDHRFTYHRAAAPDRSQTRPECPGCGKQGIGGPFGRTNPAEWLRVINAAAEGSPYEYADWLAGEAALLKPDAPEGNRDHYIFVGERKEYLPCRTTTHVDASGVPGTGFSPEVYARWLSNGVEMDLVSITEVPDVDWS